MPIGINRRRPRGIRTTMSNWIYEDKILLQEDIPKNSIAFLYLITHKENGKWYIGRLPGGGRQGNRV